jgi:hypothetical protein
MSQDCFEIHFDEKRGHLELACEPDAFAIYREVVRGQLKDMPQVPLDKVVEINIVDSAAYVTRRANLHTMGSLVMGLFIVIVLVLAAVGAWAVISKFFA